jgi:hypothetical protein
VVYQALYSKINNEGFLETPALKLFHDVAPVASLLENKIARKDVHALDAKGKETKEIIVKEDSYIDAKAAKTIEKYYGKLKTAIQVRPYI